MVVMESIETTSAHRSAYGPVLKALQRDLSGYRIEMQAYEHGAIGFGAFTRAKKGEEEGWAVIVKNPSGVMVGKLVDRVRQSLLSAIQNGEVIKPWELAAPKSRVISL